MTYFDQCLFLKILFIMRAKYIELLKNKLTNKEITNESKGLPVALRTNADLFPPLLGVKVTGKKTMIRLYSTT